MLLWIYKSVYSYGSLILKTLIVDSELIFSIQLQYTPVEYFIIYGNITDISIYNNYKVFYNILILYKKYIL